MEAESAGSAFSKERCTIDSTTWTTENARMDWHIVVCLYKLTYLLSSCKQNNLLFSNWACNVEDCSKFVNMLVPQFCTTGAGRVICTRRFILESSAIDLQVELNSGLSLVTSMYGFASVYLLVLGTWNMTATWKWSIIAILPTSSSVATCTQIMPSVQASCAMGVTR